MESEDDTLLIGLDTRDARALANVVMFRIPVFVCMCGVHFSLAFVCLFRGGCMTFLFPEDKRHSTEARFAHDGISK